MIPLARDPEFERKHPRNPADGRFVRVRIGGGARKYDVLGYGDDDPSAVYVRSADLGAPESGWTNIQALTDADTGRPHARPPDWAQRVSDAMVPERDMLPLPRQVPLDGRQDTIADLATWTNHIDDGQGYGRFDGMEFWDEFNHAWRSGDEAQLQGHNDPDVFVPEIFIHGDDNYDEVTFGDAVIWRHTPDMVEVDTRSTRPDPVMEYYFQDDWAPGMWIPGSDIDVEDGTGNPDMVGAWLTADTGYFNQDSIQVRLRVNPAPFVDHPGGVSTVVAEKLLDPEYTAAWTGGGYQIKDPDTGTWHTIRRVEQNYDLLDSGPEKAEHLTLTADGLVIPDLDTSEEIHLRRTPLEV